MRAANGQYRSHWGGSSVARRRARSDALYQPGVAAVSGCVQFVEGLSNPLATSASLCQEMAVHRYWRRLLLPQLDLGRAKQEFLDSQPPSRRRGFQHMLNIFGS